MAPDARDDGPDAGPDDPVELRSDTCTRPTPEMRQAMADAEVGNASWGEDPTVNALEARCAELFGKDAGMFVPSGTMGNQAAIRAWTSRAGPAPEVLCHERSHIYNNEAAALATVGGAQARPLPGEAGRIPVDVLEAAVRDDKRLRPTTTLISLENTHNYAGGKVLPLDYMAGVRDLADDHGLPVHLDGARVFNAAVALGVEVEEVAAFADTVQFCFSKGLACPVGSMLVGPADVMEDAFHVRQALGGAMRQAGVVAAPALLALDTMVKRLEDDHRRARALFDGIVERGLSVDATEPDTNIVVMDLAPSGRTPADVAAACAERGVRFSVISDAEIRAVTHYDVDDGGIERAVEALADVLG